MGRRPPLTAVAAGPSHPRAFPSSRQRASAPIPGVWRIDPTVESHTVHTPDSPWYISQPHGVQFDPETPTVQILAETEAMCRNSPDFMPIEAFRDRVRAQLGDRG